jgi:diadenosine tetraphosphate (Ap4A) HIT family hydrolase
MPATPKPAKAPAAKTAAKTAPIITPPVPKPLEEPPVKSKARKLGDGHFRLHAELVKDTAWVGDLPLCRVLLMNNRLFPWVVLVPKQNDLKELVDLNVVDLHRLMDEIAVASRVIQEIVNPDKLNVATLGNKVEQLHVHVIGRLQNDSAWPEPVWGEGSEPYKRNEAMQILQVLQKTFASKERLFTPPNP